MKVINRNKNQNSNFSCVSIILFATLLMGGCATGKGQLTPQYRYGNPDYTHVSDLPQNQAAAWDHKQPPTLELPEITGEEYEARGDALLRQKNFSLAYLQYENALTKNPDNIRVEYKIGMTYLMAGKLDDALKQFEKVSENSPETGVAWEGQGRAHFLKRNYHPAEKYFFKALALNNYLWESHNFLGYIYDVRKDHAKAISQYLSALAIKPDCGSIYNNLGVSYSLTGHFPEAVEAFKAALTNNYAHKKVYNNLGLALANTGRYGEALDAFKKGVGEPLAYNNLGSIHLRAGHFDEAIRCFERAVELDPRFNARVRENLNIAQNEKMRAKTQ